MNTLKGKQDFRYGYATWTYNIFYNTELCWFAMEWTPFDNCWVKRRSVAKRLQKWLFWDFLETCTYLNLNPVLLSRHFQYRVEPFLKSLF